MNDQEMNEMIKKAQQMIQNNEVPDNLKSMVSMFQSQSKNSTPSSNEFSNNYSGSVNGTNTNVNANNFNLHSDSVNHFNSENANIGNNSTNTNSSSINSDIDFETIMKLQNIMSKMKNSDKNDDMSKLLLSLKPYLRDDKKGKVDEYIQLLKVGKFTQLFESLGGGKK